MDYKQAGVDIDKADLLIENVEKIAKKTYNSEVISGIGGFAALYDIKKYKNPVIVSSTDGIGTKIILAQKLGKFLELGYDLVAMCVDDVVCCGAKPLFFLDYISLGKLNSDIYLQLIESISQACKFANCAFIGGETAEMPDLYKNDDFDIAGFCVGIVEKDKIIKPDMVKVGDSVIGLASSGFHSNGYSLIRKIIDEKKLNLDKDYGFGILGNELLIPTEIYSPVIIDSIKKYGKKIKGIAHITGGGLVGNVPRVIPQSMDVIIYKNRWKKQEMFNFIIKEGNVSEDESYKVFNMGIGMVLIVDSKSKDDILSFFNKKSYKAYDIGVVVEGNGIVRLKND